MAQQHTLNEKCQFRGVGVHSGKVATVTLRPAPVDTGILFIRTDVSDKDPIIEAKWDNVVDTKLCTVLANKDDVRVSTIEHLMSAFWGCGVDNVIIEIDNDEMPIMDGSAKEFVSLLQEIGLNEQNKPRKVIKILKEVSFEDEGRTTTLKPASIPSFGLEIDFTAKNSVIGKQDFHVELLNGNYFHEISSARTFGLLEEVEYLKSIGLARGGSLDNAIVVDREKILNPDGLRFKDEFVRHKILDAIGDLYLAGAQIIGEYQGVKAGHEMNNKILHVLFENPDAWEFVEEKPTKTTISKTAKSKSLAY